MVKQCPQSQTRGWGPADVSPTLSTDTLAEDKRERESGAGQVAQSPSQPPGAESLSSQVPKEHLRVLLPGPADRTECLTHPALQVPPVTAKGPVPLRPHHEVPVPGCLTQDSPSTKVPRVISRLPGDI